MRPFQPLPYACTKLSVAAAAQTVTLSTECVTIMVDNRGTDDLLVEFGGPPSDTTSMRIPSGAVIVLTRASIDTVWFKRAGSTAGDMFCTQGRGF